MNRIYFFDAMRAVLIIFIVLIHVLQVFNPEKAWLIFLNESITSSRYLLDFLMLFTLESFFMISGYFVAMSLKRININIFFESRIKRIFIPIFVTSLTINSIQTYLLVNSNWMNFNLSSYFLEGQWISHLWFLIDLSILTLLTYFSVRWYSRILNRWYQFFTSLFERTNVYIILMLLSLLILLFSAIFTLLSHWIYNPIINISSILYYFPFFLLGILLFTNKPFYEKFLSLSIVYSLLVMTVSIFLSNYFFDKDTLVARIAFYFFDANSSFFASAIFFNLFYRFFNKKNRFFTYIAKTSYSIYLFHHILVIFGALLLMHFNFSTYINFIVLFFFTLILSLMIDYFLISKSKLLSLLYNGK